MPTWIFEPGHTEAEFRARHMMVTWVRGLVKDVHGRMEFSPEDPLATTFEGEMDATKIWTGEDDRDAHLRSPDFFDVDKHPAIAFEGRFTAELGPTHFKAVADLTIRGPTHPVELDVSFNGEWSSPFWVGEENKGSMRRIGFAARGRINRQDFGVAWQDEMPGGGVVVSNDVELRLDVEAIALEDLEATGAIEYYR